MEKLNHELKDKINSPAPKSKTISAPASPFINNSKPSKPLQVPAQIRSLENARVIQRNLVYIINLPQSVSDESVLSSPNYFGKYGKILRIHINRGVHNPSDPTFGAYLTYGSEEEAICCVRACNDYILDGKKLSVTFGTTKYCSYFLKNSRCPKTECLFLHSMGSMADTIFREDILNTKHIQAQDSVFDRTKVSISDPLGPSKLPDARVVRDRAMTQQMSMPSTEIKRIRLFSRDLSETSKFEFIQDSDENPVEVPVVIRKLRCFATPRQDIAIIPYRDIEEILSPSSPDKWAVDVLEIKPCDIQSNVIVSNKKK